MHFRNLRNVLKEQLVTLQLVTQIYFPFSTVFGARTPRKVSKADARKAFAKLDPDAALVEEMLRALDWQKRLPEWTKDCGQFIPYPATWLNARRWEDEPEAPEPLGPKGGQFEQW